ncbi:hypothetical protein FK004_09470 [Flavobacterium kingsejongi]|uniref:TonB-dependent receptor plug domain-containing protein n=2 Tax=Flavobacterium kingsejongi TaxID=1678728 RepID=A0A2S1LP86_9FLAO|nr:hypothetical protein FK004_09470 [Flavobacterium kingsejongi]
MIRPVKSFWLLAFLLIGQFVYCQHNARPVPLQNILATISKMHEVQFNYLEKEVAAIQVVPPSKELSLSAKLTYLEQQTGLQFARINEKYIAVSSKKAESIPETESLEKITIPLQEITIARYLTTGISKSLTGAFIIKPKHFGILPGLTEPDVLQTMQQLPGIYSADETTSNLNVRSGTHDQNLFLWNGIRLFQTGHFFGMISVFSPTLTEKVTIFKNGTSAFYGESTSSLVAITSFTENEVKPATGFSSNLISAEFHTQMPLSERANFRISARRSYTDLLATPTYQNYYDRVFQNTIVTDIHSQKNAAYHSAETFYFYDFTAQYQQKIGNRSEVTAAVIGISNVLDIHQENANAIQFRAKNSQLEQQNFGVTTGIQHHWNENHTTKADGYISYYNLDATNNALENNQNLNQQNRVTDMGIRIEDHQKITSDFTFSSGYQYNEIGITNNDNINKPVYSRKVKEVVRSHAAIVETVYQPNNRFFLKTGLRTNYIETFSKFILEPRLQLDYALTTSLHLEISGERKSQTASQIIDLQQDFLGIEKRRWTLSNETTIPIQRSSQIAIGFTYKTQDWLLSMDNYYKKVSGISSRSQAFQNQLEFIKINGDYSVLGSEFLIQRNFGRVYSWLSYGITNSEYTFDTYIPSQFTNNFQVVHSISWAGVYEYKQLKIAVGSKWHSGRPETTPLSSVVALDNPLKPTINYNMPNNTTLSDYFQVNFSAAYTWQLQCGAQLELAAAVLNILDKKNLINRYYRVNTDTNSIESVNTYSLSRTPNLSVKYTF